MVIRGTRTSLARARMIRNARRSRSGKVLSNRSARNTSSRLNRSSRTNQTSDTKQTKQIALYEEVQKAADDMQKTVKALLKLDTVKVDATTKEESTVNADTMAEKTTTTGTSTKSEVQTKGKTEEEQKKEIISGVKDLVEQYNVIYRNLDELGGSVNTTFLSKLKQLMRNSEDELKKMGVSLNKDGTLSVTAKTLESADLKSLKDTFCKSNGIADKLTDKAKDIENSAASTIQVMNRMYGTQTLYNKYGASGAYYGNNGSWYNALG